MKLPPDGLTLPCKVAEVRDGDTVVVTIGGGYLWPVRLRDCWCPESRGKGKCQAGVDAKAYAVELVTKAQEAGKAFHVHVPLLGGANSKPANLLKKFVTFDRLVGDLFIDGKRMNDLMVKAGHATKRKGGT